jgi:hypothetical protein
MADARPAPEIPPASVFLALLHAFAFRLPSFQQLDAELAHSYLQNWIGAERSFRDDTLRYSLCGFNMEPLERMLVDVNRRLKRRKAFDRGGSRAIGSPPWTVSRCCPVSPGAVRVAWNAG